MSRTKRARPLLRILSGISPLLLVAGCAQWDTPDSVTSSLLRSPSKTLDTAVLQTCFVSGPLTAQEDAGRDWLEIDEQQCDSDLRHRLAANGLRCGVAGRQLPSWLQQMVDERVSPLEASLTGESEAVASGARQQVIQSRSGRVSRLMVHSRAAETMAVLFSENGEVQGEMFSRAQGLFRIRTFPQGDGRVRVEATPEIEYGDPRQRWVGQEGMFIMDTSRSRRTYENLAIDVLLSPGQTLVVGCAIPARGLGATFFGLPSEKTPRQRLLLIRLEEVQGDDLFPALNSPSEGVSSDAS